MSWGGLTMPAAKRCFQLLFFVVLVFFFFRHFVFFFFFLVGVIRNYVEMDGMRLRDFHFHFALGAAQNFTFFYFVFIHVKFGGAIRTADHGSILRCEIARWASRTTGPPPFEAIIYRVV